MNGKEEFIQQEVITTAKGVTLGDIAKACDTSIVTVSKALTDKKGVSDELRKKIKSLAEEMGYVSSRAANIRNNHIVGVVIPERFMNPNGSFYWALYNDLVKKFSEKGYYCLIEQISEEEEDKLVMPKLVMDGTASSVVSLGQLSREYAAELVRNMPNLLLLDYYIHGLELDSVTTDGYGGGYELTSYLCDLGHTEIGYIGTMKATSSIFDRYMGYMKAMIDNGLEVRKEWTLDDRDRRGFIRIAFPEKLPTAFVCNCDEAAFHTIRQLEEMGLKVPEDISVVGYDNYLISEVSKPSITTINVNSDKMAAEAVRVLLRRLESPDSDKVVVKISGELIIKESAKKNK
ncbi:LacI family DNA-binding transcriptional regulator [Ruminococcus sp.]|uniref:LacI family DNA-binding transcriptional regulator n=1 Tax=Ruminococcus sp. TaxID=41978 RepID=UPI0025F4936A|nr:LacI family DNA-binding transcriptional regulator [Ruminococcus sp.]